MTPYATSLWTRELQNSKGKDVALVVQGGTTVSGKLAEFDDYAVIVETEGEIAEGKKRIPAKGVQVVSRASILAMLHWVPRLFEIAQ